MWRLSDKSDGGATPPPRLQILHLKGLRVTLKTGSSISSLHSGGNETRTWKRIQGRGDSVSITFLTFEVLTFAENPASISRLSYEKGRKSTNPGGWLVPTVQS
jgi:hypothetical protein